MTLPSSLVFLKTANFAEDMPWYTAAAGAGGGALAARKFLPNKYKALGEIGGAVLGTGVGVEAGKAIGPKLGGSIRSSVKVSSATHYLPAASYLAKLADVVLEPPQESGEPAQQPKADIPHPAWHALKAVGSGLLGFGAGTMAGYGAQVGLEKVLGEHVTPSRLRMAVPVLGGLAGLAYQQYKSHEHEELSRALESYRKQRQRRVPNRPAVHPT